jgi:hypothetical protein
MANEFIVKAAVYREGDGRYSGQSRR